MIKLSSTLFLLCLVTANSYTSVPPQKKYGQWSQEISITKNADQHLIEIGLFQEVMENGNTIDSKITWEKMAHAKCTYHPDSNLAYIDEIYVFDNPTHRKGCGSYLLKQLVAKVYATFNCNQITLLSYPFTDTENEKSHENLKKFYLKLGAMIIPSEIPKSKDRIIMSGTRMCYPLRLAAILSFLMPLLESTLPDSSLKNDPITTIIQYVGPRYRRPDKIPKIGTPPSKKPFAKLGITITDENSVISTYLDPANIPSSKADCASIKLL